MNPPRQWLKRCSITSEETIDAKIRTQMREGRRRAGKNRTSFVFGYTAVLLQAHRRDGHNCMRSWGYV